MARNNLLLDPKAISIAHANNTLIVKVQVCPVIYNNERTGSYCCSKLNKNSIEFQLHSFYFS